MEQTTITKTQENTELTRDLFTFVEQDDAGAEKMYAPSISYWQDAWRRLKQNRVAMASLLFILGAHCLCHCGAHDVLFHPFGRRLWRHESGAVCGTLVWHRQPGQRFMVQSVDGSESLPLYRLSRSCGSEYHRHHHRRGFRLLRRQKSTSF